jgi:hypothetical protein
VILTLGVRKSGRSMAQAALRKGIHPETWLISGKDKALYEETESYGDPF